MSDFSIYEVPGDLGSIYEYPEDPNQKIWRYIDFTKFVDLLVNEEFFFPRATLFDDKLEGSYSQDTIESRNKNTEEMIHKFKKELELNEEQEIKLRAEWEFGMKNKKELHLWKRDWTYVSCWHMNDVESAAMWSLYAKQSIAIQTTFKKLFSCLNPSLKTMYKLYRFGVVHYIDFRKDKVPEDGFLSEYFYKRKSFAHEYELRVVVQDLPKILGKPEEDGSQSLTYLKEKEIVDGISSTINLNQLLEEVYVAPTSSKLLHSITQKILFKYGYENIVKRSSLEEDPLF